METGLRLLMDDGGIHVAFQPKLTVKQYGELMRIADRARTKEELREALELAARLWDREVEFDDLLVS